MPSMSNTYENNTPIEGDKLAIAKCLVNYYTKNEVIEYPPNEVYSDSEDLGTDVYTLEEEEKHVCHLNYMYNRIIKHDGISYTIILEDEKIRIESVDYSNCCYSMSQEFDKVIYDRLTCLACLLECMGESSEVEFDTTWKDLCDIRTARCIRKDGNKISVKFIKEEF